MQNNTSTVQYAIIGIFVVFIVIGIIVFAGFTGGNSSSKNGVKIKVWGVFPLNSVKPAIDATNLKKADTLNVSYTQHSLSTFDNDLASAIAQGEGPDMVILPEDHLLKNKKLFVTIPYTIISQRTYQDSFAAPANIFLNDKGITALPILIDPLVMYWNKDIFATAGVPTPPNSWKGLVELIPKISNVTTSKTVLQSAVSFGEYSNVKNAKEILTTLFFQAGNSIVELQKEFFVSTIYDNSSNSQVNPAEAALSFYTQFANPSSVAYSWNKSLPSSDEQFLRGKSATYIGFASEYENILSGNPNLNFDVSVIPQAQGSKTSVTYAKVYGIAIVNASKNQQSALTNAEIMVSTDFIGRFSQNMNLPSVRVDQLGTESESSFGEVFRRSVLIGKDWYDPDSNSTGNYFKTMIESVSNGSATISDAVKTFDLQLKELLK
ncbi:MAG: extracellular solute-binding protein [Candidatus Paceibacterota bacterium]